jgi:hypothetical protein
VCVLCGVIYPGVGRRLTHERLHGRAIELQTGTAGHCRALQGTAGQCTVQWSESMHGRIEAHSFNCHIVTQSSGAHLPSPCLHSIEEVLHPTHTLSRSLSLSFRALDLRAQKIENALQDSLRRAVLLLLLLQVLMLL